jgi:hypothetical protein
MNKLSFANRPSKMGLADAVAGGQSLIRRWGHGVLPSLVILGLSFRPQIASGEHIPGGGTGAGPNVTVTDNGDGTVTLANGLVSIIIVKTTARLNEVNYTHKNSGTAQTTQVLQGKGQYYYGRFMLGSGMYEYSLGTDPEANGGG